MISLFIGRFQPFHNGHFHALQDIVKNCTKVIIAIGSSQESHTKENPFSFKERSLMVSAVLKSNHIEHCDIVAVPDIHDDEKWVDHVCSIVPKFDVVYTGNEFTKELFEKKGMTVKHVSFLEGINATIIRDLIERKNNWVELVPKEVSFYLTSINAEERISNYAFF